MRWTAWFILRNSFRFKTKHLTFFKIKSLIIKSQSRQGIRNKKKIIKQLYLWFILHLTNWNFIFQTSSDPWSWMGFNLILDLRVINAVQSESYLTEVFLSLVAGINSLETGISHKWLNPLTSKSLNFSLSQGDEVYQISLNVIILARNWIIWYQMFLPQSIFMDQHIAKTSDHLNQFLDHDYGFTFYKFKMH